jgi:hypothetical protein
VFEVGPKVSRVKAIYADDPYIICKIVLACIYIDLQWVSKLNLLFDACLYLITNV